MKRVLLFLTFAVLAASFTSCDTEKECEKNNTGEVFVTNNLDFSFGVYIEYDSGQQSDIRSIAPGENTSWVVTPGIVTLWVSEQNDEDDFWNIGEVNVSQCGNHQFSIEPDNYNLEDCEKFITGEITIVNDVDIALWFDAVKDGSLDENENRRVQSGASTTYNMPAGKVDVWVSHVNDMEEFWLAETVTVKQCETEIYTLEECYYYYDTEVTVVNEYDFPITTRIWVDLGDDTGVYYPDEDGVDIESNSSHIFPYVPIGEGRIQFDWNTGEDWNYHEVWYDIYPCEPFQFTWTPDAKLVRQTPKRNVYDWDGFRQRINKETASKRR